MRDCWEGLNDQVAFDEQALRSRLTAVAIFATIGVLVWWASVASVDKIVRAEGRIIPSARTQVPSAANQAAMASNSSASKWAVNAIRLAWQAS
jgi:multidrug efflux pump subunit AcrA (membrane-fusion protein)